MIETKQYEGINKFDHHRHLSVKNPPPPYTDNTNSLDIKQHEIYEVLYAH